MKLVHKSLIQLLSATYVALSAIGCAPMSNSNATTTGGLAGALGGAALGGIAGHQSGRGAEGAIAGGLGGALYGAQNGSRWFGGDGSIDKTERER